MGWPLAHSLRLLIAVFLVPSRKQPSHQTRSSSSGIPQSPGSLPLFIFLLPSLSSSSTHTNTSTMSYSSLKKSVSDTGLFPGSFRSPRPRRDGGTLRRRPSFRQVTSMPSQDGIRQSSLQRAVHHISGSMASVRHSWGLQGCALRL